MEYSLAVCSPGVRETKKFGNHCLSTSICVVSFTGKPISTISSWVCPCHESFNHDPDRSIPSQLVGPMLDPQPQQELLEATIIFLRPALEAHSISRLPDHLQKALEHWIGWPSTTSTSWGEARLALVPLGFRLFPPFPNDGSPWLGPPLSSLSSPELTPKWLGLPHDSSLDSWLDSSRINGSSGPEDSPSTSTESHELSTRSKYVTLSSESEENSAGHSYIPTPLAARTPPVAVGAPLDSSVSALLPTHCRGPALPNELRPKDGLLDAPVDPSAARTPPVFVRAPMNSPLPLRSPRHTLTSSSWRGLAVLARLAIFCAHLPGKLGGHSSSIGPGKGGFITQSSAFGLVADHFPTGTSSFLTERAFCLHQWKPSTPPAKTGYTSLPLVADPPTLTTNFFLHGAGRFPVPGFFNASSGGLLTTPTPTPFLFFTVGFISGRRSSHVQYAQKPGTRRTYVFEEGFHLNTKGGGKVQNCAEQQLVLVDGAKNRDKEFCHFIKVGPAEASCTFLKFLVASLLRLVGVTILSRIVGIIGEQLVDQLRDIFSKRRLEVLISTGSIAAQYEEVIVDPGSAILPDTTVAPGGDFLYVLSTSKGCHTPVKLEELEKHREFNNNKNTGIPMN
uniref:Uncharacterized protein n=1 Tax=Timema cristinae TaxID=61476 RepID=A0A7R9CFE8_TIMCR|nr:unnamed protein product [Timema cristinae]